MEFDLPRSAGLLLGIIAIGVVGLTFTPMSTGTILMMVLPSMVVFAAIAFTLGVKHGEYRASP
jgi:hypothetical protein